MNRSLFFRRMVLAFGGVILYPSKFYADSNIKDRSWNRIVSERVKYPEVTLPRNKRIPLGWNAFAVPAKSKKEEQTIIYFPKTNFDSDNLWLRITAAIDFREYILISVYLAQSGKYIGEFDIKYAHPFQPFQIKLKPSLKKEVEKEGILLKMEEGRSDVWFFLPDAEKDNSLGLQPHLLVGTNKNSEEAFWENLLSMNSLSPFGWMGGCVHDALWTLGKDGNDEALKILEDQLGLFLDNEKGIIFQNPRTESVESTFNSIEDFLPFAAINGLYPDHPSIEMALEFLSSLENEDGVIASGSHITTEACYTIGYPLAAIAITRNSDNLVQKALNQLKFRKDLLATETTIYQRSSLSGDQSYPNWGRGVAWYLLGMAKTLELLAESRFRDHKEIKNLQDEFIRVIEVVLKWQEDSGLWNGFIDRKETGVDTSASAGIATAILIGCKLGLLDSTNRRRVSDTYQSLLEYLTPDGFLTHVSQINRGGEELQASGYRVIAQFGMGLMGQLGFYLRN